LKPVTIRSASRDDFESVYEFINALEDETLDRETQWRIFDENISRPEHIYLMATIDGTPAGFISCHVQNLLHHGGAVGEIQELFVAEDVLSIGIGKMLTDRLKEIANERGVLQLEVTSGFKREDAHRFYAREEFGFTHKKFVFKFK
jgi:PhnO protein